MCWFSDVVYMYCEIFRAAGKKVIHKCFLPDNYSSFIGIAEIVVYQIFILSGSSFTDNCIHKSVSCMCIMCKHLLNVDLMG